MVESQTKTTKKEFCNEFDTAGRQVPVSTVNCASTSEADVQERSPCPRYSTLELHWSFLLITWTKKKLFGGKLCDQMEQRLSCLAPMTSNMFGGEQGRPLSLRTPYLLSNIMVVVVLYWLFCCQWTWRCKESK